MYEGDRGGAPTWPDQLMRGRRGPVGGAPCTPHGGGGSGRGRSSRGDSAGEARGSHRGSGSLKPKLNYNFRSTVCIKISSEKIWVSFFNNNDKSYLLTLSLSQVESISNQLKLLPGENFVSYLKYRNRWSLNCPIIDKCLGLLWNINSS